MWPLNCFLFRYGMVWFQYFLFSVFSLWFLCCSFFGLWKGINKSTASRARQRKGGIVNHDSEMCQQTSNNSHGHNSLGHKKSRDLKRRAPNPKPGPQLHQLSQDIASRTSIRAGNFWLMIRRWFVTISGHKCCAAQNHLIIVTALKYFHNCGVICTECYSHLRYFLWILKRKHMTAFWA